MSYFPMCVELTGKRVLLVGNGPQSEEKLERLLPFLPHLEHLKHLEATDLTPRPVMVIVGDLPEEEALHCSRLCIERDIPVNVVDRPELCSFVFPALIGRGELTVAVTTGGKSPAAAAWLRRKIEGILPEQVEEILECLSALREELKKCCPAEERRAVLQQQAAALAFERGRALMMEEVELCKENATKV